MESPLLVVCPHCQAVNRVLPDRMQDGPTCGRCKDRLFTGHPLELRGDAFYRHLERGDLPLLIDFWAPWCGPCRAMAPSFIQAAAQLEPRVRLGKVNVDEEPQIASRFSVASVPTLVLFRGGREAARQVGALPPTDLLSWVRAQLV